MLRLVRRLTCPHAGMAVVTRRALADGGPRGRTECWMVHLQVCESQRAYRHFGMRDFRQAHRADEHGSVASMDHLSLFVFILCVYTGRFQPETAHGLDRAAIAQHKAPQMHCGSGTCPTFQSLPWAPRWGRSLI